MSTFSITCSIFEVMAWAHREYPENRADITDEIPGIYRKVEKRCHDPEAETLPVFLGQKGGSVVPRKAWGPRCKVGVESSFLFVLACYRLL
jgi:hypothetical protein